MSTPAAQPPQAIANNRVVGNRHTVATPAPSPVIEGLPAEQQEGLAQSQPSASRPVTLVRVEGRNRAREAWRNRAAPPGPGRHEVVVDRRDPELQRLNRYRVWSDGAVDLVHGYHVEGEPDGSEAQWVDPALTNAGAHSTNGNRERVLSAHYSPFWAALALFTLCWCSLVWDSVPIYRPAAAAATFFSAVALCITTKAAIEIDKVLDAWEDVALSNSGVHATNGNRGGGGRAQLIGPATSEAAALAASIRASQIRLRQLQSNTGMVRVAPAPVGRRRFGRARPLLTEEFIGPLQRGQRRRPRRNYRFGTQHTKDVTDVLGAPSGPSNRDMHALNGNIDEWDANNQVGELDGLWDHDGPDVTSLIRLSARALTAPQSPEEVRRRRAVRKETRPPASYDPPSPAELNRRLHFRRSRDNLAPAVAPSQRQWRPVSAGEAANYAQAVHDLGGDEETALGIMRARNNSDSEVHATSEQAAKRARRKAKDSRRKSQRAAIPIGTAANVVARPIRPVSKEEAAAPTTVQPRQLSELDALLAANKLLEAGIAKHEFEHQMRRWDGHEEALGALGQVAYQVLLKPEANGLDSADSRKYLPREWREYEIPNSSFLGIVSTPRTGERDVFGIRLLDKSVGVQLPPAIISELVAWLAHRPRTDVEKVFQTLVIKCRALCRHLAVSPAQRATIELYAPVVAWQDSKAAQKSMDRVLTGAGCSPSFYAKCAAVATLMAGAPVHAAASTMVAGPATIAAVTLLPVAIGVASAVAIGAIAARYWFEHQIVSKAMDIVLPSLINRPKPPQDPEAVLHRKFETEDKEPNGACTVGIAVAGYEPVIVQDCVHNEEVALHERITKLRNPYEPQAMAALLNHLEKWESYYMGRAKKIDPLPFPEWLDGGGFEPDKRERYQATHDALEAEGFTLYSGLPKQLLHDFTTRKTFLKRELTLSANCHGTKDKAGRLIQAAEDEMTVLVGPWIAAFAGYMKNQWKPGKSRIAWSISCTREQAAAHVRAGDSSVTPFENDQKEYDFNQQRPILEAKHRMYARYGAPLTVRQLLEANLDTHGLTKHGYFYAVDGMVKSGDCDTSCGNSWVNGVTHDFIYCTERGITPLESDLMLLVQGDDDVGSHTGAEIPWAKRFAELGFVSKPVYRSRWEDVEYCSETCTPALEWTFTPKIGRLIPKISYSLKIPKNRPQDRAAYARASALSMRGPCRPNVIASAYIERVLQLTQGAATVRPPRDYTFKPSAGQDPTDESTHAVLERYLWDLGDLAAYERELASVHVLGTRSELPMCALLCDRDTDGPQSVYGPPIDLAQAEEAAEGASPSTPIDAADDEVKVEAPQVMVRFEGKTTVLNVWDVAAAKRFVGAPVLSRALVNGRPALHEAPLAAGDNVELTLELKGGSRVSRGETLLKHLGNSVGCTKDGICWVLLAIDPMHDRAIECRGYCDTSNNGSIRQTYKPVASITAPVGLTSGNYDCYVVSCPWKVAQQLWPGSLPTSAGRFVRTTPPISWPTGGCVVITVPAGIAVSLCPQTVVANYTMQAVTLPASILATDSRDIGHAFEVTNTTSALNKQGTCTCYRVPQPEYNQTSSVLFQDPTASPVAFGYASATLFDDIPPTIAAAMQLPGSVQWEAAEGCYMVGTFNSTDLPEQGISYIAPLVTGANPTGSSSNTLAGMAGANAFGGSITASTLAAWNQQFYAKNDMMVAAFTGLSNSSTLNLSVIDYVEEFPSWDDTQLVTLATPSPSYDPAAIQLYSAIMRLMPVACRARDNGAGEWFLGAIGALARNLGPLMSLTGNPYFGAAGAASTTFGNWVQRRQANMPASERSLNIGGLRLSPGPALRSGRARALIEQPD